MKIIELRILAKIRKSNNGGCRCYASRWFDDQYWKTDPVNMTKAAFDHYRRRH